MVVAPVPAGDEAVVDQGTEHRDAEAAGEVVVAGASPAQRVGAGALAQRAHRRRGGEPRALGHIGLANFAGLAVGPLIAAGLGGAGAARTVLAVAVALPLLGAAAALAVSPPAPAREPEDAAPSTRSLIRRTGRAGFGLLLVNVGYVSVLGFGAEVARRQGTGLEALVVPVFAVVVILARTLGAGLPDRLGGRRMVIAAAGAEAVGLAVYALAGRPPLALGALLVLSAGQSLAVPGLGLLALAGVPAAEQGAAAGAFFAWFDAGVGAGGPLTGGVAQLTSPSGALVFAGVAVAGAVVLSLRARPR